jgi:hypothetical protein
MGDSCEKEAQLRLSSELRGLYRGAMSFSTARTCAFSARSAISHTIRAAPRLRGRWKDFWR